MTATLTQCGVCGDPDAAGYCCNVCCQEAEAAFKADTARVRSQRDEAVRLLWEWMDDAQAKKRGEEEWCDNCSGVIPGCPCKPTRAFLHSLKEQP